MINILKYLPSKKFTKTIIVFIIVGAIVLLFSTNNDIIRNKNYSKKTISLTTKEIIEGDRDNDGVRDWEESLWGTNPDSKDTNNDGIDDFEYIELRRKEISEKQGLNLDQTSENLNETDLFSRDIFASIISLKEKGMLTQEAVKQLAEATGKSFLGKVEIEDIATSDSLKIITDSPENRKAYIKQIDTILAEQWKKGINQEFSTFGSYIETQNPVILSDLTQTGDVYAELSKKLLGISVPTSLAVLHLDFINTTHKMSVSINNIAQAESNEIMSAVGITQYRDQSIEFNRILDVYTILVNQYGTL